MKTLLQNTKVKNVLKIMLALFIIIATSFAMTACGEDPVKPEIKVSASQANIEGISATVGKTETKKFVEGEDLASRVNLYSNLGELKEYNVTIAGTVSKSECDEKAIAMNDGNVIEDESTPVGYYTDFFQIKILVPEGATQVGFIDGNSQKLDEEISGVDKDGYYTIDVQWLLGDANKTFWNICGNAETNDGYFYYKFLNDNGEIIDQFFVCVNYDVNFVA